MADSEWHHLDIQPPVEGTVSAATVKGRSILIGHLNDEIFAFARLCPHAGGEMERCEVSGFLVSCPFHGWQFDLSRKGEEIHGYMRIRTYEVKRQNTEILIKI